MGEMSCDLPEDPQAKGGQETDSDWRTQELIYFEERQVRRKASQ